LKINDQNDGSDTKSEPSKTSTSRWASLSSRKRVATLVLLVAAAVLLLGSVRLHTYVQTDSQFCLGTCHLETETSGLLAQGPHKDMDCGQCHDLRFSQNAWLYALGKVQGPKANTPHAHTDPGLCKGCHESGEGSKLQVTDSVGHVAHAEKAKLECASCHGQGSHDLAAKQGTCKTCHPSSRVLEKGMEDFPCESCHKFLAPGSHLAPAPATECRSCHDDRHSTPPPGFYRKGRVISNQMIHGAIFDCATCHQPHEQDPKKRRTGQDCARCHTGTPVSAAAIKNPSHSQCGACHREHSPREELTATCATCHVQAAPDALKESPAGRHPNCGSCHFAHDFTPDRAACSTCHKDHVPAGNLARIEAHSDCTSCHAPHRPAAERDACAGCHTKHAGHAHQSCVTCHDPHKDKTATKSCASCHGAATVPVGKGGHAGGCQTCHAPHGVSGASARCGACHAQVANAVKSAGDTPHGKCSTCHRPHTFVASAGSDGCRSCHKLSPDGAHRGECRTCHTTHGSPRVGTASCAKCHADIPRAKTGKHADCRSCHGSHEPAAAGGAQCAKCHTSQQAGTRAWSASQHQNCMGCHPAHNPSAAASCTQCHANVKVTGPAKHTCRGCHDPHQAPRNWQSQCASCHKGQASAARGRGPTHSTCNSCHKSHSISKPSCTTCHNAMATLGAHGIHSKQNCSACHDTHARTTVSRTQCLSCHKNMTDHNPTAKSCASCHPFR
jgi:hypothetical protein